MPTHLDWSSLTADRCRLRTANSSCLSSSLPPDTISPDWSLLLFAVDCPSASPFANRSLWVPFSNSSDWRSLAHCPGFSRICLSSTTSGLVGDLDSKLFVWFRAKTSKGIVCLADHPHSVKSCSVLMGDKFFSLSLMLFSGRIGDLCNSCFDGDFGLLGVVCVGVIDPTCVFVWTTTLDLSHFPTCY